MCHMRSVADRQDGDSIQMFAAQDSQKTRSIVESIMAPCNTVMDLVRTTSPLSRLGSGTEKLTESGYGVIFCFERGRAGTQQSG